jgi:gluconate/galactonate dehydratase
MANGVPDAEITDVQTMRVDGNFTFTLVRVYTDQGVYGTGEAYWGDGVVDLIHRAGEMLVGETPCDVDRLHHEMVEGLSAQGSIAGTAVTAISGLEIALNDLAGKLLGVPAYQLLGGKYRDEVRVYVDCHAGAHAAEDTDDDDIYEPEAFARAAEAVADDGFDALKFDLDAGGRHEPDDYNRHLNARAVEYMSDIVHAATDAVGDRADVAFDMHWNYTGDSARRVAAAVEDAGVLWLEDPVPPENHDVQKMVTESTDTPVCAGENVYRREGVRRLIEEQAVDVVQPDMPKFGGMREVRKAADHADSYYVPVALHNVSSPLGTMAGAHVATAVPNFLAIEWHSRELDWWGDMVEEAVIVDGRIPIRGDPGLGLTLDMDVCAEHLAEGETLFDEA